MKSLSPRQMQVLELRARGYCYKEIAAELGISPRTVKFHVTQVMQKTRAISSVAAAWKMITARTASGQGFAADRASQPPQPFGSV